MTNYMKSVFCPAKGKVMPANSTDKDELRCTGCGNVHSAAKAFMADLSPMSTKHKKFKKGGKSKGKSKDKSKKA